MSDDLVRVLLAEDSPTVRDLLTAILQMDPKIRVVGCAKDGHEAVELTRRLRPSLVLMDVQMPKMDGFRATKTIMVQCPTPIIVMSANVDVREVGVSMEALKAGALTVLEKPVGPAAPSFEKTSAELIRMVKALADVKTVRHWPERKTLPSRRAEAIPPGEGRFHVLAIAASTGGPQALATIFSGLDASLTVPVLVVQHIGGQFLNGFAKWLNGCTSLRVKVAAPGERAKAGTVYLPAEDRHLEVRPNGRLMLSAAPPVGGFRPSASTLFDSAAKAYGDGVLAVILTGMGRDGAAGLHSVRQAGGYVIAQDEPSSIVFGMPKAAVESDVVDSVAPLGAMAASISELISGERPRAHETGSDR